MSRSAARGTLQLAAEEVVLLGTGYVATLLLARGLGPEAFGLYGIVLSVVGWAEYSGQFGLPSAATKLIAEGREDEKRVGETTIALGLILFSAVFLLFVLGIPVFARALRIPGEKPLFLLAAFDIPLYGIYLLVRGVGLGRGRYRRIAAAGITSATVKLVGVLILAATGFSVFRALLVLISGSAAGVLVLASGITIRITRPDRLLSRRLVSLSIPLALSALGLSLLHNLHLWLLKSFSGEGSESAVGIYVAASHIAKAPEMVVISVGSVLFPTISRAVAEESHEEALSYIHGALRFLAVVLLPVSLLVVIDAEKIMTLLFSTAYAGGGEVLALQILGYGFLALFVTFAMILLGRGEFGRTAAVSFGSLLLMLVSGFVLVPRSTAVGAAGALLAASAAGAIVAGVFVRRGFGGLIAPRTFLRVGLATAVTVGASLLFRVEGVLLLVKFGALAVLYLLTLAATGELHRKDIAALRFWA
jgi:PST family polysaccharide transporter